MLLLPEIDWSLLLGNMFWVSLGMFPGLLFNLWVLVNVLTAEKEKRNGAALVFSIGGFVSLGMLLIVTLFNPPGESATSWFEFVGIRLLVGGGTSLVSTAFALIALAEHKEWMADDDSW